MLRHSPAGRLVAASLAAALLVLGSCESGDSVDQPPGIGGGVLAPIDVDCLMSSSTVLAGSSPVFVFARVTRGNRPVSGATVSFSASRGLLSPVEALSDAEGMATAQFTPPGTAGNAQIAVTVTDRREGDTATSGCAVSVQDPGNPRLGVQLLVPATAAGLEVRVIYDPSRVSLPLGAARAGQGFSAAGCIAVTNDDDAGIVELDIACATAVNPAGFAATFDFLHLAGGELAASDFTVSCTAFDVGGRAVGSACTSTVTQL